MRTSLMDLVTTFPSSILPVDLNLCYFFAQLAQHPLMRRILIAPSLSIEDFNGYSHEQTGPNAYCIIGFPLSASDFFHTISILKTRFGSVVEMMTFDTAYFDQSTHYFNTDAPGRVSGFCLHKKERHAIRIKRVKRARLLGRQVDCSIQKCPLYGCKIILSF
ncbi:hypothetical protein ACFGVR_13155 [Mucilaginibacter sp. AW1-3]